MGKYDALQTFLLAQDGPITLEFGDVAELVGGLPPSAYQYREWWANSSRNPQALAWQAAGRRVETVNLTAERVRFGRPSGASRASPRRASAQRPAPPRREREDAPGRDLPSEVAVATRASWRRVGVVSLTETSELVFPALRPEPGVYRLTWWTHDAPGAIYVGESDSLQRRMHNYRRPGPTQATSKRVHSLLVEHLSAGGAVDLEVLDVDVLQVGGTHVPVDLRLKAHRVLLEHAALAVVLAGGTRVHNR